MLTFAGLRQSLVWAGRQPVQPLCPPHLSRHLCHHQRQKAQFPPSRPSEWGYPWPPSQTPYCTPSGRSSQSQWARPPAIPAALHNPRGCSQGKAWPHWASAQQVSTVFCIVFTAQDVFVSLPHNACAQQLWFTLPASCPARTLDVCPVSGTDRCSASLVFACSRSGAEGSGPRSSQASANGVAAGGPLSQDGPQTQMAPGSTFTQSFSGLSQDGFGVPRDYDFKSQDSIQSDSLYMTQQFPAYQTQVGRKHSEDPAACTHTFLMSTQPAISISMCTQMLCNVTITYDVSFQLYTDCYSACHHGAHGQ